MLGFTIPYSFPMHSKLENSTEYEECHLYYRYENF